MSEEIKEILFTMGRNARKASYALAMASEERKNVALNSMANNIEKNAKNILEANNQDVQKAKKK